MSHTREARNLGRIARRSQRREQVRVPVHAEGTDRAWLEVFVHETPGDCLAGAKRRHVDAEGADLGWRHFDDAERDAFRRGWEEL